MAKRKTVKEKKVHPLVHETANAYRDQATWLIRSKGRALDAERVETEKTIDQLKRSTSDAQRRLRDIEAQMEGLAVVVERR